MTRLARFLLVIVAFVLVVGCSRSREGAPGPAKAAGFQLDAARAVSVKVDARAGGTILAKDARGVMSEVELPPGSLSADTEVEIVPLVPSTKRDETTIVDGIIVRKKGDASVPGHLPLAKPALLRFALEGSSKRKVAIVRYSDDGASYTPVPTTFVAKGGSVLVQAEVAGFSAYGVVKDVVSGAVEGGKEPPADSSKRKVWVLSASSDAKSSIPFLKVEWSLLLKATSTGGREGQYVGPVSLGVKAIGGRGTGGAANVDIKARAPGTAALTMHPQANGGVLGTGTLTVNGFSKLVASGGLPGVTIPKKTIEDGGAETLKVTVKVLDTPAAKAVPKGAKPGEAPPKIDAYSKVSIDVENVAVFTGSWRRVDEDQEGCTDKKRKGMDQHRRDTLDEYPSVQAVADEAPRSLDEATMLAVRSISAACAGTQIEWGGAICEGAGGDFKVVPGGINHCGTDFSKGEVDTRAGDGCPGDGVPVAQYHCHPPGSKDMSQQDKENMRDVGTKRTIVVLPPDKNGRQRVLIYEEGGGQRETVITVQPAEPPPKEAPPPPVINMPPKL